MMRGKSVALAVFVIPVLGMLSCGDNKTTSPSATGFAMTLSGTAVRGAIASQTVSIPRAGSGTFTLSGFSSGELPVLEVRTSSGISVGRSECPSSSPFCTSVAVSTSVQAATYEVRVSGGNIGSGGTRFTVAVNVN
jgi:hypothetical protein